MTKPKSGRVFSIFAAILLIFYSIPNIATTAISSLQLGVSLFLPMDLLEMCTYFVLAIVLFTGRLKAVLVTASGLVLIFAYYLFEYFSIPAFLGILSWAMLIVVIVLALKEPRVVNFLWFLPAIFLLGSIFSIWMHRWNHIMSVGELSLMLYRKFPFLLQDSLLIISILLIGLWLVRTATIKRATSELDVFPAEDDSTYAPTSVDPKPTYVPVPVEPEPAYIPVTEEAYVPVAPTAAVSDDISKLKMYKELLDSGILTQEEFDAKKKQILGL